MEQVTKTQLKAIAESKGYILTKGWEAYSKGQRKVWAVEKDGITILIGNGKDALNKLNSL